MPLVAHRAVEGRQHRVADLDSAEPQPARIVAFEQSEFAIERARVGVENVADPRCGELPGFLREENIDQPQPVFARFGPAIGKRAHGRELALLDAENASGALAETLLVERVEVAERDRVAAAWRELMRQLGERIRATVPVERLRLKACRRRAGIARHRLEQAAEVVGGERRRPARTGPYGNWRAPGRATRALSFRRNGSSRTATGTASVRLAPAHHDDRLAACRPQHVALPGLGPVEGLRRGAGHGRLQLLPHRFEALDIAGDAERDFAKARLHGDRATPRDPLSCDLGLGAKKGSRTHTQLPRLQAALPAGSAWQSFCKEHLSNWGSWIKTMPEQG